MLERAAVRYNTQVEYTKEVSIFLSAGGAPAGLRAADDVVDEAWVKHLHQQFANPVLDRLRRASRDCPLWNLSYWEITRELRKTRVVL